MATKETTITELELAEEVLADMVIPVDTSTDTKSVSLKQLRAWLGSSLPTGFILPAVGKINDERFTLLDGKTLSKQGTYGAFCAKVEAEVQAGNWLACTEEEYNADITAYNQCGKFVIGVDYVRIPTITRFIGATVTLSEIGKTYKESLPQHTHTRGTMNITGKIGTTSSYGTDFASGAFYNASGTSVDSAGAGNKNKPRIDFDASKSWTGSTSNASGTTYQDGAKVQPDHTKYPYYMVISTEGQTANVEIDINKVYEDLELKANKNLSNLTAEGKSLASGFGMPTSSKYVDLTLGASSSTYTAPYNGYFSLLVKGSNTDNFAVIQGASIALQGWAPIANGDIKLFYPVLKGREVSISYGKADVQKYLRFYATEGEK